MYNKELCALFEAGFAIAQAHSVPVCYYQADYYNNYYFICAEPVT
jgi:hypothetical protein